MFDSHNDGTDAARPRLCAFRLFECAQCAVLQTHGCPQLAKNGAGRCCHLVRFLGILWGRLQRCHLVKSCAIMPRRVVPRIRCTPLTPHLSRASRLSGQAPFTRFKLCLALYLWLVSGSLVGTLLTAVPRLRALVYGTRLALFARANCQCQHVGLHPLCWIFMQQFSPKWRHPHGLCQ